VFNLVPWLAGRKGAHGRASPGSAASFCNSSFHSRTGEDVLRDLVGECGMEQLRARLGGSPRRDLATRMSY